MAEESTIDSTPTILTPPTETPVSTDTSTTAAPEGETLLTPKEEAPNPLFGAPDTGYEISGLPEGMTVDKEALAAFEPIAKELGLSNEGMSKVAAAYAGILPKVTENVVMGIQNDIAAQHSAWANESIEMVKSDPVFGGKPLTEIQQVSAKALDRFAGPEFRTFLEETGLGNHPGMVRAFYQAGSAISEDTTFERGGAAVAPKSRTDLYYPKGG